MNDRTEPQPTAETLIMDAARAEQPEGTAPEASGTATDTSHLPSATPRVRAGAIVWGLLLLAGSWAVWSFATSDTWRGDLIASALTLGPVQVAVGGVLVVGALLLLIVLVAVINRAQRRRRD